jgi:hypothetical protein
MSSSVPILAQSDGIYGQLRHFLETLASTQGILGGVVFLFILGLTVARPQFKWVVLGLLLFASTLSFAVRSSSPQVLMFPLEQLRRQGRGITLGLLAILLIRVFTTHRGWRTRIVLGATVAFFAFELIFSARLAFGGMADRGVFGALILTLTFVVMGVGLSRWLQEIQDVHALMRAIAFAGFLLVFSTSMQLVKDRSQIIFGNRLFGITGNPQQFAIAAALCLGPTCYLVIQRTEAKFWRLGAAVVAGFLLVFLIATGSRTGALMALINLGLLFRLRLGRLVGFVIAAGVFFYVAAQFFFPNIEGSTRLVSLQNTREGVWGSLIDEFTRSPVIGVLHEDIDIQESSYLSTAARFGFLGLIPLAVSMLLIGTAILRLHRLRKYMGDYKLVADATTAGLASLFVGAAFEGILLGTLSIAVFFVYIDLTLLAFVTDLAEAHAGEGYGPADVAGYDPYESEYPGRPY